MRLFLHTGLLLVVTIFAGCSNAPPKFEYVPLTTPALERIPALRKSGASVKEWEANLAGRIESIESDRQLRSVLAPWELSQKELNHWTSQLEHASKVIFYGTDLDGRMVIFYNRDDRSFASWASWDPPRDNIEFEQAVGGNGGPGH